MMESVSKAGDDEVVSRPRPNGPDSAQCCLCGDSGANRNVVPLFGLTFQCLRVLGTGGMLGPLVGFGST